MKAIYIDEDLHGKLKLLATRRRESLKTLVESLLDRGLHLAPEPSGVSTEDMEALAARGGSFDFLEGDAQDVYSLEHGESIESPMPRESQKRGPRVKRATKPSQVR